MNKEDFKKQVSENVGMELMTLSEFGEALGYHPKFISRFCKERRINSLIIRGQQFIPRTELERVKKDGSIPSRN